MIGFVLAVLVVLCVHPPEEHVSGEAVVCRCDLLQTADGWCHACQRGFYAGVPLASKPLLHVLDLHGHDVDPAKTRCARCRDLIAVGGFCAECRMGYLDGQGYFSRLCYTRAHGVPARRVAVAPDCGMQVGWCKACHGGRIGERVYTDEERFREALLWQCVLESSLVAEARCGSCAAAMLTDGHCFRCRVTFSRGSRRPAGVP